MSTEIYGVREREKAEVSVDSLEGRKERRTKEAYRLRVRAEGVEGA